MTLKQLNNLRIKTGDKTLEIYDRVLEMIKFNRATTEATRRFSVSDEDLRVSVEIRMIVEPK